MVVVLLLGAAAVAVIVSSASASLTSDPQALAKVGLPLGGGRVTSVVAVTGSHARPVPVVVRGDRIWPKGTVPAGERITIDAVVKRPGWISWLAGSRDRLHLVIVAPTSRVRQTFVTVSSGPLRIHFTRPVVAVFYGPNPSQLSRHALPAPTTELTLARTAEAGSVWVAGAPRTWETSTPTVVSWFPAGVAAAAVANPAPGSSIQPNTPITLTFSKTVSQAIGTSMPPVSPITAGTWHQTGSHTIVFRPEGYGYGLGAHVTVGLPAGVKLVGGQVSGSAEGGSWTVPPGSTLRLQQLLATAGYLPLTFSSHTPVAPTPQAQVNAAVNPPSGSFKWRYGSEPSPLRSMWQPGTAGVMTRGAVMAFENDHGLTPDGSAGPAVWKALIAATLDGRRSSFGYTFVSVSTSSESLSLWHDGHTVMTTAVNTGIPSAPTATGTYPVFEHSPSVTMSGTNPDGSHYSDPGVPWVSYFNGGDALHGFLRASYGSAQSLGCVEMPYDVAHRVYGYTPIGTLVHVS